MIDSTLINSGGCMDVIAIVVGIGVTLSGLLCIGLAIPLALGRVRRNGMYGVRFRESLRSDDAWVAINRFGGRRLIVWSLPVLVIGAGAFFLPLQARPGLALAVGFLPLLFIFIAVFESWRFARRYGEPS
jgi:hypothetical protein